MTKISEHIQKSHLGSLIELFQIDLTIFNEGILYLVPGDELSTVHAVTFDGQVYSPHPIKAEGFELSGQGPLPRPSFAVSNVKNLFTSLVLTHQDLLGATITRIRTYDKFLDNGADPDPTAILPLDVYTLNKKTKHNREEIHWELAAAMDQAGTLLPGRQVVRDFCDQEYRTWVTGTTFDYSTATCPYTGTTYLDEQDQATTAANDRCGKRLGSCKARFGATNELPFRGFPGVARLKIR